MDKEVGVIVSGASTVPEQIAAYFLGLKTVCFAAVTNPGSGLAEGWTHSGEENLIAAKKCLERLSATMNGIIKKVPIVEEKRLTNILHTFNSLRIQRKVLDDNEGAQTIK